MKRTLDMLAVLLALFAAVHAVWAWAELREVAAWNEGVGVNQGVGAVSSGLAEVFVEFLILIPPITMTTLRRRQRQAAIAVHRWYAASTICLLLMSLVASPFGLLRVAAVVSLMGAGRRNNGPWRSNLGGQPMSATLTRLQLSERTTYFVSPQITSAFAFTLAGCGLL
jgi:hypothetical protein